MDVSSHPPDRWMGKDRIKVVKPVKLGNKCACRLNMKNKTNDF